MEAAIQSCQPKAIWLDSLCVPSDDSARAAVLRQMGAIYGRAAQVIVVLSSQCAIAIEQIEATGEVAQIVLPSLEADDWVTRAWTYQECANSAELRFCTETVSGASVSAIKMLDAVGHALVDYGKVHGVDAFGLRRLFPALDALQDVLAEWLLGGIAERTAFQAMTAVGLRSPDTTAEDRLNAMIGAVDPWFASTHLSTGAHPASLFMQACEAKGDYSFIYTPALRSSFPGRTWQPAPGPLPAILAWHSFGQGQHGEFSSDHLQLRDMAHAERGALSEEATEFIVQWLASAAVLEGSELSARVLERLRQAAFSGSGASVDLEQGLFFPHGPIPPRNAVIMIATGVRWVHGAPALALLPARGDTFSFGDVGVFVGPIPDETGSVTIG